MDRRRFLAATGTALLGAVAGCSDDSSSASGGSGGSSSSQTATDAPTDAVTDSPTAEPTDSPTATDSPTPTETESPTATATEASPYQARISYDGEWSGTVGGDGSTRSVDGDGTETFDVSGDPFIVSANAQKRDGGSGKLTVEILQGGDVIARQSTTAEHGLAQVTSEDGISDGGDSSGGSGGDSSSSSSPFEVRVEYDGEWSGSISVGGSSRTVEGTGSKTVAVDGNPSVIAANAQKQTDSSGTLTIQILKNGEVEEGTSTSADYGVAQVSYSDF